MNKTMNDKNIVIGSSTIFIRPADSLSVTEVYYRYSPIRVLDRVPGAGGIGEVLQDPFTTISLNNLDPEYSFTDLAQKQGIVFVYELIEDKSKGNMNY